MSGDNDWNMSLGSVSDNDNSVGEGSSTVSTPQTVESENTKQINPTDKCYCNKERDFNITELLCANCNTWFHKTCIEFELGELVPFMVNYIFICKNCSSTGLESFRKYPATVVQMCVTAIGNLTQNSFKSGNVQDFFSRDNDLIPFIVSNWEIVTTSAKRAMQSRNSTIKKTLSKETNTLFGVKHIDDDHLYKLLLDLSQIKPNYAAMIKNGHLKVTETGIQMAINTGPIRRGTKRKVAAESQSGICTNSRKGKNSGIQLNVKLPAHGYPLDHPFNKDGFKYILAESDPHAQLRQTFEESNKCVGKLIPSWLYRPFCSDQVLLALHDRAPQLHISDDRLSVTGEKGYSMVRATHSVGSGNWYWEVIVQEMPGDSACRIGWSLEFANLQAPLGYDKFGYSWRSRKGTVFHESRGKHFSDGFGKGDILGLMICLPNDIPSLSQTHQTHKDLVLIKFKNYLYFEKESCKSHDALKSLKTLIGSKIILYKNGVYLNESAVNLYKGKYFPTLSLYKNCTLSANFGPDFQHPPPEVDDFKYKGMWERASESVCEHALSDINYLTENDVQLQLNDICNDYVNIKL